jgi:hypothetical protein
VRNAASVIVIATAVITSTFVARATRERDAAQRQDNLSDRELMEERFDALERRIDGLASTLTPPGPDAPRASH